MPDSWKEAISVLKKGGVGVLPTDTLFGLVGSALSKDAVKRIYNIKGRDEGKPVIVLISSFRDLKKFNVHRSTLSRKMMEILGCMWPGKVSIILPCTDKKFTYLHRGTNTIAFRMIGKKNKNLFNLLKKVGPLVAPSANPQGLQPAKNITEAKKYFHNDADFYISATITNTKPSTLLEYKQGEFVVLRKGAVEIK